MKKKNPQRIRRSIQKQPHYQRPYHRYPVEKRRQANPAKGTAGPYPFPKNCP